MAHSGDPYERAAECAVGRALLFRESRSGGTRGNGLDQKRAEKAARDIDGDGLYALLMDAAKRAIEDAQRESAMQHSRIIHEVRRLAERSDSLSLHRFIEQEDH